MKNRAYMSSPILYSELLLNIRYVNVFVVLPSYQTDKTTVKLSPDRKFFHLSHDSKSFSIELPCEVSGDSDLVIPVILEKSLLFRLQLSDNINSAGLFAQVESPFPAHSLSATTQIACSSCQSTITEGKIETWRDVPRENWAEMMDFWHCHRPNDSHIYAGSVASEGYAASNVILARQGLGLVDKCHLIVFGKDCSNIEVSA